MAEGWRSKKRGEGGMNMKAARIQGGRKLREKK